ncbi:CLUMA_CG007197, isoform A [Clunio marinus]|uniref:CLUMA_CG007197, isoform A n=1 Tax=Clunio marinus TaxID=568069 RepID=A0A1J1I254_9DIPT|nr:CLUMA_CG007197, isoform A [Clunio marinus]
MQKGKKDWNTKTCGNVQFRKIYAKIRFVLLKVSKRTFGADRLKIFLMPSLKQPANEKNSFNNVQQH